MPDKTATSLAASKPAGQESTDKETIIDGQRLKLTNPDKVFWPAEGYTKGDLIDCYLRVSPFILPYLKGRLQSLNRFPDSIDRENFFQKNLEDQPTWVKTVKIYSESIGEEVNFVLCENRATLIYLANLGCIEINT